MSQVKKVIMQEGFERQKRGYRNIDDFDSGLNDPLFTKQWYLVSNYHLNRLHALMPDLQFHSCSWQIHQIKNVKYLSNLQSVSSVISEQASSTPSLFPL